MGNSFLTGRFMRLLQKSRSLAIQATWIHPKGMIGLEIPQTKAEFETGLMHRPTIGPWRGMWFRFRTAKTIQVWTKNCLTPLDFIFINGGLIVDIQSERPPCLGAQCPIYASAAEADGLIELQGGRAAELGLTTGLPVKLRRGSLGLGAYRQPVASLD